MPVVLALLVTAMLVSAGAAHAVPWYMWRDGVVSEDEAPVYAESVDGWACHIGLGCRSAERTPDDPPPIWTAQRGDPVQVECYLGEYYKIHADRGEGWILISYVADVNKPVGCYAGDF
ncbi:hypothetical protein [Pseudonocardia kunmingensis]|uniref:hypothetical protein n=1 Tax=Pseudonocardia kunmingensis TaxID=630975 RepID=UPI001151D6AF|nr:hypothetical protein [Pseudonocardia kunmingensis]